MPSPPAISLADSWTDDAAVGVYVGRLVFLGLGVAVLDGSGVFVASGVGVLVGRRVFERTLVSVDVAVGVLVGRLVFASAERFKLRSVFSVGAARSAIGMATKVSRNNPNKTLDPYKRRRDTGCISFLQKVWINQTRRYAGGALFIASLLETCEPIIFDGLLFV